jgi:hypothetical protein
LEFFRKCEQIPENLESAEPGVEGTEAAAFFWSAATLIALHLVLQDAKCCFFFSWSPLTVSFLASLANFFSDAANAFAAIADLLSLSCQVLVEMDLGGAPLRVG